MTRWKDEDWRNHEQATRNFQHDGGAVDRWKASTPKVLRDAIQAGWNGTATDQQKRLLKNWVTARVMGASIESSELLLAHLDAKKRGK